MSHVNRIQPPNFKDVEDAISQADRRLMDAIETFSISLVTPMFGGSSQPGVVDATNPIRNSSIRGHLRFWWRATRGAAFQSALELRKREVQIFGDTHTPSRVKLKVEATTPTVLHVRVPQYVSFALRDDNQGVRNSLLGYSFKLHIQYQEYSRANDSDDHPVTIRDLKAEIHSALWAWINFGGIGSRTRRGCGSLYCAELSPDGSRPFEQWFSRKQTEYGLKLDSCTSAQEWPTLSKAVFAQSTPSELSEKWNEVIELYHDFRSRPNRSYKDKNIKKCRSHWPEADSLRYITGMSEDKHKKPAPWNKNRELVAFPRAQLGLPIIFNFRHSKSSKSSHFSRREPYKMMLTPIDKTRLASPLILKPLAFNATHGVGMIVKLNQPKLKGLKLKITEKPYSSEVEQRIKLCKLTESEIYASLSYSSSPMKPVPGQPPYLSAVDAFLASEEVQTWKK